MNEISVKTPTEWKEKLYKKTNDSIEKWTTNFNRHSSKKDTEMANKHTKRC